MKLEPTIAWSRDAAAVFQHSGCGSLVYLTGQSNADRSKPARGLLTVCPWTGCPKPDSEWWEQRLPVGPFESDGQ